MHHRPRSSTVGPYEYSPFFRFNINRKKPLLKLPSFLASIEAQLTKGNDKLKEKRKWVVNFKNKCLLTAAKPHSYIKHDGKNKKEQIDHLYEQIDQIAYFGPIANYTNYRFVDFVCHFFSHSYSIWRTYHNIRINLSIINIVILIVHKKYVFLRCS